MFTIEVERVYPKYSNDKKINEKNVIAGTCNNRDEFTGYLCDEEGNVFEAKGFIEAGMPLDISYKLFNDGNGSDGRISGGIL